MPLFTLHSPLYLASSNPGKLREFREAASARGIRVKPLPGIESLPACIEDGRTFEENARKKALHYSAYVSGPVFADDSGISVDALRGAPGVFSARFARPDATDDENNRKLLEELRRVETAAAGSSPASLRAALEERGIRPASRTNPPAAPRTMFASSRWRSVAEFFASPREERTALSLMNRAAQEASATTPTSSTLHWARLLPS